MAFLLTVDAHDAQVAELVARRQFARRRRGGRPLKFHFIQVP